uniref:Uncharacterized protein n=1 Tax=Micromonas pusilla TaxID=38833 RepID=A0A7S0PW17_MICPS|mmetsp:Transcript_9535/g.37146  ORF Transcript_9535/g.37146 Transcript_9535/m.37146 type:complete len:147 (+) Transcript_9535:434-874(+)
MMKGLKGFSPFVNDGERDDGDDHISDDHSDDEMPLATLQETGLHRAPQTLARALQQFKCSKTRLKKFDKLELTELERIGLDSTPSTKEKLDHVRHQDRVLNKHVHQLLKTYGCTSAYIDVGSNIGVQMRKLYEPWKYAGKDPNMKS